MGEDPPYEKAIEETAKATSNAINLVREGVRGVSQPIATAYGLLIGDHIAAARDRNLDAINRKTKKILHDRDVHGSSIPEQIAVPLLEAAQGETRDELQDLWARLLANAMDPSRSQNVRPEFIETVRLLQPIDVKILSTLKELLVSQPNNLMNYPQLAERLKLRDTATKVSLDHLGKLGCTHIVGGNHLVAMTEYSKELMIAVAV